MEETRRPASTDPFEIDLAALRPPEGSVLHHALARLRRDLDRGARPYACFINNNDDGDVTAEPGVKAGGTG